MSLRARLLVAALALVAVGLLAADVVLYSALHSFLYDRVDNQLAGAGQSVQRALFVRGGIFVEPALRELGAVAPGVYVQVRDPGGQVLVTEEGRGRDAPRSSPRLPAQLLPSNRSVAIAPDAAVNGRVLTVASSEPGGPRYRVRIAPVFDGGTLVVALPLTDTAATLDRLAAVEVGVTLMVLAGAGVLGLWLVRLGLRPLVDIETTAARIAEGDLSHRVARDDTRTEVGRLGRALNKMLATIDAAFAERRASEESARLSEQRMRRFVGDASHELRTPLAAVRAYAELYRRGADQHPDDLARLLARIEEEAARMGVLVDDLLLLTRLDEGRPLDECPVDLGAIAADAVAAARTVDPRREIEVEIVGSVEVEGDAVRLRQVVDNLLANVRAHTPPGAPARVVVRSEGHDAFVEVADRGPGLGAEQTTQVFERFYRADPARSRDHGGSGLGLSIVAAIARAHGGDATVEARKGGGAVFRVRLPLLDDSTPPASNDATDLAFSAR